MTPHCLHLASPSVRIAFAAAVAVSGVVGAALLQDGAPAPAPAPAPSPAPIRDGGTTEPAVPSAEAPVAPTDADVPAGMVRVPAGRYVIGIDVKEYKEWLKTTTNGGKSPSVQETLWKDEQSLSTPAHTVELPEFFIGKYEVTNAQWQLFLDKVGRVEVVVPPRDKPGPRTLLEISNMHLLGTYRSGSGTATAPTVRWEALYDIHAAAINPANDPPKGPAWANRLLAPGTKITTYRWSLPENWQKDYKQLATYPEGMGDHPVVGVSLKDAEAFGAWAGVHVPRAAEWEAACRGPKGHLFPEGEEFDPLAHYWSGFNEALRVAKEAAPKKLEEARRKLAAAQESGNKAQTVKWTAEVAHWESVGRMKALREGNLTEPVGGFPRGASPFGAMDMVGNVDEWTSDPVAAYPKSETGSLHVGTALEMRGGNLFDPDTVLTGVFRKIVGAKGPFRAWSSNLTGGFRVARYDAPGASAAAPAVKVLHDAKTRRIMPGETDPKTHENWFLSLNVLRTAGVERMHTATEADPANKVFFLGPTRAACVVPLAGTPFADAGKFNAGADPAEFHTAKDKADPRTTTSIPLVGLVWMSPGMELKGEKLSVTWAEEATPAPAEPAKGNKKPGDKPAPAKPPAKPPEKPKPGDKPEGEAPKEGEEAPVEEDDAGEDAPEEEGKDGEKKDGDKKEGEKKKDEPKVAPKRIEVVKYEPGVLRGQDHAGGLLLGYVRINGERRGCLWEARPGTVGSSAPGGHVLLERPLLILPKDGLQVERASKEFPSSSSIDTTSGAVTFRFFVPTIGKKEGIGVRVNLGFAELGGASDRPWTFQADLDGKISRKR